METGRSLLLTWCIATYMANFLKDLLVVPRLSRHDPSLRLYRTILLRGVQTNSRASLPTKKKEVDQEEEEEEDVPQPPETLPEAEAPVSGFLPLCVNTTLMIA